MSLQDLGWDDFFAAAFPSLAEQGLVPARVVAQKGLFQVSTGEAEHYADLAGKLRHELKGPGGASGYPAVGDWVALRPPTGDGRALIQAVLPRKSKFSRKVAGQRTDEQVVAANLDTIFLVSGLDGDFNPRRIERYLTAAWDSGARPVVVLNKLDRCEDPDGCLLEAESIAMGVPVHRVSALTGESCEELAAYLGSGQTVSLLGSSGVGKSTLINRLLGREVQRTREVREDDDRGRHTTTHRELFAVPAGGLLIDTPGLREIQLWEGDQGIESAFADVESLAESCRFADCRHHGEPGCAVEEAAESGVLSPERLESYRKLQRELRQVHLRQDALARLQEKRKNKSLHKAAREHYRLKPRG
ncbi:MAG TPA: ribosome small subunit-dependent GTPase A [Thermoanaerobaculia bacterium]|jgi:ribosome biogenesis GTPase|nr:ribosome small subunit-dependent GTPase A [Thermoanaerobaculia bacterium]